MIEINLVDNKTDISLVHHRNEELTEDKIADQDNVATTQETHRIRITIDLTIAMKIDDHNAELHQRIRCRST